MVDPDPGYRPRRADDGSATGADQPPGTTASESGTAATPGPVPTQPVSTQPAPAGDGSQPTAASTPPAADDEDQPKPLYRDEPAAPRLSGATPLGEETRVNRPVFKPRARRTPEDDDSTTLLPRTPAGRRPGSEREERLDDDDQPRSLLGRRGRLALLVGALAAVIAVGLAVMYAISTVGNPTADPGPTAPTASGPGSPTSTGPAPGAVLADAALLDPTSAARIAPGTWTVALTQRPPAEDAPTAACFTDEPAEGQPVAQQEVLRLLTESGRDAPSALHRAAAYSTPEEAAQAYTVAAMTLGGCASPGAHIVAGSIISGLGDQSTGLIASVVDGDQTQLHSIVLSRSGNVVNLVDAARAGRPLGVRDVAAALAAVTEVQCQAAGQPCAPDPVVKTGPPPLGGDVPGFLATGDLPPTGKAEDSWVATPAEPPSEDFQGSQCETVTWDRLGAETASSRVYLVPSSTKFGLNDIVLTMKSDKAASDLVAKIKADLDSCEKRKLTATVSDPKAVTGQGASAAPITGWTADVAQKSTQGTQAYRVGIVASGPKVAYTFLNPLPGGYEVTDAEWDVIAVRAGQRMTQVP
jgi:hypothetical protein